MGKLEKYSSYKDSSVAWLEEIPEHWKVKKIKHLVDKILAGGTPESSNSKYWTDILEEAYLWVSIADMTKSEFIQDTKKYITTNGLKNCSARLIPPYSILYSIYASLGKVAFSEKVLTTNQAILSMIFKENYYYKFMFYYLQTLTQVAIQLSNSTTQDNISLDVLKNLICSIPPKEEQTEIALFLDEKTEQLDKVISQKEKLMELLKERKQIVINESVTKGLNKDVEFVDSGVEWIGKIPKHWEVKKLKFIFSEVNERSETGDEELLSLSKYQGVIPKSSLEERAGMAKTLVGYKKVFHNNLVINKMQAVNGLLAVSKIEGITSPDYAVYRTISDKYNIDYYGNLLNQSIYLSEFKKVVTGVMEGFIRLYTDDLYNILVQVPPNNEQLQIIEYIENQTTKIDKAIELQKNYIQKLKEYKSTLIDSVVTGKVRV
jgi:type I restriction enzyme, S subunit